MKIKIFGIITILIITTVAVFNVNVSTQENEMSLLAMINVEALANNENGNKGNCRQSVKLIFDVMNGAKCSANDRYNSYYLTITNYSCGEGSAIGSGGCKVGNIRKGNDCNTPYDENESVLKKVC